jgi:hypothetical protein
VVAHRKEVVDHGRPGPLDQDAVRRLSRWGWSKERDPIITDRHAISCGKGVYGVSSAERASGCCHGVERASSQAPDDLLQFVVSHMTHPGDRRAETSRCPMVLRIMTVNQATPAPRIDRNSGPSALSLTDPWAQRRTRRLIISARPARRSPWWNETRIDR